MQQLNSSNTSLTTRVSTENMFASGVLSICFTLGLPGNIAVMVRLTGWLKGGSFTPRLMLNLAISDLLSLLFLPMWIWAFLHGWIFGSFLCKFLSYVMCACITCSVLCVILMSAQRYMQVLHPQKWAKIGGRERSILLIGTWILSSLLAFYVPIQRGIIVKNGQLYCGLNFWTHEERVATSFWEILLIIVPFLLLANFYCRLYLGVNRSALFKTNTLTKLVTRILVTYLVVWVPFLVNNILLLAALLLGNDRLLRFAEDGSFITKAVSYINSCVNPLLYTFSAQSLQQQPKRTLNA